MDLRLKRGSAILAHNNRVLREIMFVLFFTQLNIKLSLFYLQDISTFGAGWGTSPLSRRVTFQPVSGLWLGAMGPRDRSSVDWAPWTRRCGMVNVAV